jgi:hypothetical protein
MSVRERPWRVALLCGIVMAVGGYAALGVAFPRQAPGLTADDQAMAEIVATAPQHMRLLAGETVAVTSAVKINPEWMLVEVQPMDGTGKGRAADRTRLLIHRNHGTWSLAYKGTDRYDAWMRAIRSLLIAEAGG